MTAREKAYTSQTLRIECEAVHAPPDRSAVTAAMDTTLPRIET